MYESPINVYTKVANKVTELKEDYICAQVCEQLGVSVDKDRLMRALLFDRYQYDRGYRDALQELQEYEWIPVERRLPDTEINPLTKDFNGYLCTARFGDDYDLRFYKFGNGHFWNEGQIMDEYVVAWKPRPDLYKQ